jgi:hypothetical protein
MSKKLGPLSNRRRPTAILFLLACVALVVVTALAFGLHHVEGEPKLRFRPSAPSSLQGAETNKADILNALRPDVRAYPSGVEVAAPVLPLLSKPLRELPYRPPTQGGEDTEAEVRFTPRNKALVDPVVQTFHPSMSMPTPIGSFDGSTNVNGGSPPDTTGDVGPHQYVQMVNSRLNVYNKRGDGLLSLNINQVWSGTGTPCETRNDGDPIVLYDHLADRWFVNQLTGVAPYYQCIAISQGPDPTGAYWAYSFLMDNDYFYDYQKFGLWPDGYYMTAPVFLDHVFQNRATAVVFDRARMLSGQSAGFQRAFIDDLNAVNLMPADLDGIAPPAGSPNFLLHLIPDNGLRLWRYHVNWAEPNQSTLTSTDLAVATFGQACPDWRDCMNQPGTTTRLDDTSDKIMNRVVYRNAGAAGDSGLLLANHSVYGNGFSLPVGIRWYEIRDPWGTGGSGTHIHQQGTYSPDQGTNRWMGSIAMDRLGNIALGYSAVSASLYPSIRYAGRLASGDNLGVLTEDEVSLYEGAGSQQGSERWGDYSNLTVDPVDGCTFWYTNQYYKAGDHLTTNWSTRIGSFNFPNCAAAATPTAVTVTTPANTSTATLTPTRTPVRTSTATVTPGPPVEACGTWSVVPHGGGLVTASFWAVEAISANDIWAVGRGFDGTRGVAVIQHWNGSQWSNVLVPNAANQGDYAELMDVSALSSTDVWAVGHRTIQGFGSPFTLTMHWNGTQWSVVPSPSEGTGGDRFLAVEAIASDDAWAVGENLFQYKSIIQHWDGAEWSVVDSPNNATGSGSLLGLTAVSANEVWAVGGHGGSDGIGGPLILRWNGTAWSVVTAPTLPGSGSGGLVDIDALSSSDIWAVGGTTPENIEHTLTMHWNGSLWSIVSSPNPGSSFNELNSVTAIGAGDVWAVGWSMPYENTLMMHWNGSAWTTVPSSTGAAQYNGVDAVSSRDLWTVGLIPSQTSLQPLIERYQSSGCVVTGTATATPTPVSGGATATTVPCIPNVYSDVPPDSTFHPFITCLSSRGVVGGYGDCTFRPNSNLTRGQLSKIVSNAAGFSDTPAGQSFEDVLESSTFWVYIERMYSRGILGGYDCGSPDEPCIEPGRRPYFRVNANATRGQISKIVSNAAGFNDPASGQRFEDVKPTDPFYIWVERLAVRGVMGGYECGGVNPQTGEPEPCVAPDNRPYFRPNQPATRGQTSKIVANSFFPNCQTP